MTLNLMAAGFDWLKTVAVGVGVPAAPQDPDPAPGAVLADVIPDLEADQRANLKVEAKVVPSHHDQNHVPGLRVVIVIPGTNPSPDPPVKRRTPSRGLGLDPDLSPGIRAVPGVQARSVATETLEVVPRAQIKMGIVLLIDHPRRMILGMIKWIKYYIFSSHSVAVLFSFHVVHVIL